MGKAAAEAYATIKKLILSGELGPNSLVDEAQIANSLGTSRTPVREALLRLQTESLVEIARGTGIRVLPVSYSDMREAYQAISGLETVAVCLLAERKPTASELKPLQDAIRRMQDALSVEDSEAWGDADEQFHREIMRLSGNRQLYKVGCQLRDFARRAQRVAVELQPSKYKKGSTSSHAALLRLILRGDVAAARENHDRQRRRGEDALVGSVEKLRLKGL